MHTYNLSIHEGDRGRRIPEACCPSYLAKLICSSLSKKLNSKHKVDSDGRRCLAWATGLHMYWHPSTYVPKHVHPWTCAHTFTHKQAYKNKRNKVAEGVMGSKWVDLEPGIHWDSSWVLRILGEGDFISPRDGQWRVISLETTCTPPPKRDSAVCVCVWFYSILIKNILRENLDSLSKIYVHICIVIYIYTHMYE